MSFGEYLWGLLNRPFKRSDEVKRFAEVIGFLLDEAKMVIFTVRRMWFLRTCPVEVLELFGDDYGMPKLPEESDEAYRERLRNVFDWYFWMGTTKGILRAVELVVNVPCRIREYQVDCWKLGINRLGVDIRLFDPNYLFKFGLIFERTLTPGEEAWVKKVVNLVKSAHTVFIIRYPESDKQFYWRLGRSKLGTDTILSEKGA